jgi:diaminopimelate decarboxylase
VAKPAGTIPSDYRAEGGILCLAGRTVDELIIEAGDTPLFVYDLDVVARRIVRFRAAMPENVALHYAMKANPYPPLLQSIRKLVDGLDVASGGELVTALNAGASGEEISFAGPGKRDNELAAAITAGVTINCESEGEAERTFAIAQSLDLQPRIAVRVNPDFAIRRSGMAMGGGAKPFGVDAERVPSLVCRIIDAGAEWRGFHIFVGSQSLDAEALIETQRATIALAASMAEAIGAPPPLLNLGGGFGIPYFAGELPLDVERIGAALGEILVQRPAILAETGFAIELGRWLVGECGVYLTRIIDRKISHGKVFLITDGGLHHQLAASGNFGQVVRRNYPVAIATRWGMAAEEQASIVGCLCTPLDRLADDVMLPCSEPGDIVALFMAGAYGLTASPQAFLDQQPAKEMLVGAASG